MSKFRVGDIVKITNHSIFHGSVGIITTIRSSFSKDLCEVKMSRGRIHNAYENEIVSASYEEIIRDCMGFHWSNIPGIKDVIFNPPATIILWYDGSKTIVKCQNDENFDPEKGMAMALVKKFFGDKGRYYEVFKRFIPENKEAESDAGEV